MLALIMIEQTTRTEVPPAELRLVDLSVLNILYAWRVATSIFTEDSRKILSSYLSSLLPEWLQSKFLPDGFGPARYKAVMAANEIIGVTGLYTLKERPNEAWVGWYGVRPDKQGRGMGKAILDATVQMARAGGHKTLRLWTSENNPLTEKANKLYHRYGFIKQDTALIYVGYGGHLPIVIYSLSLQGGKVAPYNGKMEHMLADCLKHVMSPSRNDTVAIGKPYYLKKFL
jgi:GNAT superfamily N-acetyltransferase